MGRWVGRESLKSKAVLEMTLKDKYFFTILSKYITPDIFNIFDEMVYSII